MNIKIGDMVEFNVLCPHCKKLMEVEKGEVIEIDTDEQKASVNTGKKYVGTNNFVIYSVRLEKLRLQSNSVRSQQFYDKVEKYLSLGNYFEAIDVIVRELQKMEMFQEDREFKKLEINLTKLLDRYSSKEPR